MFHYTDQCERPLDYSIVDDCAKYETNPNFHQPALVFQGIHDSVVPPQYAESFARSHPNVDLRLVNSGHELTDVLDLMWAETRKFLNI